MIQFIKELAEFYSLENDISNITCIMCWSNSEFKSKFLLYFFPTLDVSLVREIRREVPDEKNAGSRVDLYISLENDRLPYIIEVKKGDRNHHFGQYEEAYGINKERFGYITNYNCTEGKILGYDVKTWEGFYDYLNSFNYEDEMILGYMEYLKSVCGFIKYNEAMNLKGISAVKCFADTVKKIIDEGVDGVEIKKDKQYCYDRSLHQSFTFRYHDSNKEWGYAVFGLWFNEDPVVTIGINSRSWLSSRILEDKETNWTEFQYLSKPYKDHYWRKDDVWFELNDNKMREFDAAGTYEKQAEILRYFFKEVIDYLQRYF